jgi:hypothetical protein
MSGYNSGRHGGRPTVESGLTLDLYRLIRQRLLQPGSTSGGSIVWSRVRSGERIATIGYRASMSDTDGWVHLQYTSTDRRSGEVQRPDYRIALTTTEQPFGGRRWWFICPKNGDLVSKLHLPPGAYTFASRQAYKLAYRSQRETKSDRAISRAQDLRYRIGGSMNLMDLVPQKPKFMRWKTYEGRIARIAHAEEICNMHMYMFAEKLNRRARANSRRRGRRT